jgi:hypothetical protein
MNPLPAGFTPEPAQYFGEQHPGEQHLGEQQRFARVFAHGSLEFVIWVLFQGFEGGEETHPVTKAPQTE